MKSTLSETFSRNTDSLKGNYYSEKKVRLTKTWRRKSCQIL
jgi:hypothetical protein